jgi:tRNA(fMet)-specific endonuclease VapC
VLFILDTDHLSILQGDDLPAADRLDARLKQDPSAVAAVTIVSFQEQVQGWLAYLNKRARTPVQVLHGYAKLERLLQDYCKAQVLPFTPAAQDLFADLKKQRVRIGTLDLRIACIARTTNATLLSRNLRDFRKVPGLQVADWSR